MQQLQLFQALRSLGFVFWLSLPLIGLVFWLGSGFVGDRILSHSNLTKKYLLADTQSARQIMKRIVAIKVEVLPEEGISRVNVKTNNSVLTRIVFEFPITDISQLETALSQELGLPRDRVKELIVESNAFL
ncbi:hypothetical protein [Nostoc sphaeroides]|uniref:Uncharacterized protein n=1 Tax=Nostoc sphaeroides CCNUC1 TaxID=2653204 RepID=A0A5P8WG85_9NOSO|nr:hypothetical protein [Nostoc sphaeroides]MCC5632710.1 hypothetical protein [Nostoc sphaeroides CHAB 2801]QFS50819.1 hypothetical protein GXM_08313 [Nostoc sphaeroides CCNUC1]